MIFGGMLSLRCARFDSGDAFCIWLVALDDFTLFSLGMAFDKQFARRLELAEELAGAAVARAHRETVTDSHAEILSVAGGSAIFVEPGSPISQCIGCGVLQPVTENEIEQIEQFYFSRGHGSQIALSRVFAREFEFALASHGYQIAEQNLAFYLELPWRNTPQVPDGYQIREIAWQERERWAEMQSNSFFDDPLQAEAFVGIFLLVARAEGYRCYVAIDRASGEFAAGGAIFISPQHRIACIAGAATRPEHRRRGLQAAMLQRRLADATAAGCDLAFMSTLLETTSCRNAERQGFIRGYERAVMVKPRIAP